MYSASQSPALAPAKESDPKDLTDFDLIDGDSQSVRSESDQGGEGRDHGKWAAALVSIDLDGFGITEKLAAVELGPVDAELLSRIQRRIATGDIDNPAGYALSALRNAATAATEARERETRAVRQTSRHTVYDPDAIDEDARVVFEAIKASMRDKVTGSSFQTWLSNVVGVRMDAGIFVVGAPSEFVADMIDERMGTLLHREIEQHTGQPWDMEIEVAPSSG